MAAALAAEISPPAATTALDYERLGLGVAPLLEKNLVRAGGRGWGAGRQLWVGVQGGRCGQLGECHAAHSPACIPPATAAPLIVPHPHHP